MIWFLKHSYACMLMMPSICAWKTEKWQGWGGISSQIQWYANEESSINMKEKKKAENFNLKITSEKEQDNSYRYGKKNRQEIQENGKQRSPRNVAMKNTSNGLWQSRKRNEWASEKGLWSKIRKSTQIGSTKGPASESCTSPTIPDIWKFLRLW